MDFYHLVLGIMKHLFQKEDIVFVGCGSLYQQDIVREVWSLDLRAVVFPVLRFSSIEWSVALVVGLSVSSEVVAWLVLLVAVESSLVGDCSVRVSPFLLLMRIGF